MNATNHTAEAGPEYADAWRDGAPLPPDIEALLVKWLEKHERDYLSDQEQDMLSAWWHSPDTKRLIGDGPVMFACSGMDGAPHMMKIFRLAAPNGQWKPFWRGSEFFQADDYDDALDDEEA